MQRAALLILPAFVLLAAGAFAGDPASDAKPSPTPAKSKVAAKKTKTSAEEKYEKTSPALDRLFDKDPPVLHPELRMWGAAEMSVTAVRR
jgi:hypothetical protein